VSHTIHCPLTDICIHYNSDWSGEAIIAYRGIEIAVVARSLIIGIPIITRYPAPNAPYIPDQAVLCRAISLVVEAYLKRRFAAGVEAILDDITFPDTDDETPPLPG
jgi:hypothetical protein